jgi:neutral ceramidase
MGYAQLNQRGHGIHTRQFARAFIVEDSPGNRVVFVSVDAGMISHAVKRNVVRELQKKYGQMYQLDNVMISGTRKFSLKLIIQINILYSQTPTADLPVFTCSSFMISRHLDSSKKLLQPSFEESLSQL